MTTVTDKANETQAQAAQPMHCTLTLQSLGTAKAKEGDEGHRMLVNVPCNVLNVTRPLAGWLYQASKDSQALKLGDEEEGFACTISRFSTQKDGPPRVNLVFQAPRTEVVVTLYEWVEDQVPVQLHEVQSRIPDWMSGEIEYTGDHIFQEGDPVVILHNGKEGVVKSIDKGQVSVTAEGEGDLGLFDPQLLGHRGD